MRRIPKRLSKTEWHTNGLRVSAYGFLQKFNLRIGSPFLGRTTPVFSLLLSALSFLKLRLKLPDLNIAQILAKDVSQHLLISRLKSLYQSLVDSKMHGWKVSV